MNDVDKRFALLNEKMGEYEEMLANGVVVDLRGFEHEVKDLCMAIAELPIEQSIDYQLHLKEIIDRLIHWEELLKDIQLKLKSDMEGIDGKMKANYAYAKSLLHQNDNTDNE